MTHVPKALARISQKTTTILIAGVLIGVVASGVGVFAASSTSTVTVCVNKKTNMLRYAKSGSCTKAEIKLVLNQTGVAGVKGDTGARGVAGAKGDTGAQGVAGAKGDTGAQGVAGAGASTTLTFAASGGLFQINGTNNPVFTVIRNHRYLLNANVSGHPLFLQTSAGAYSSADLYSSGVTNNGTQSGTITFEVPFDAPTTLYYVCQIHSGMGNSIKVL